ncbi:MAG: hypothetical protein DRR19_31065 [Candidatus Parabeggiatoa sp. nov. 1]|nr:MAG: hypothetical protein DRR19_31065 [Gammaproteobacteria bacterium]
MARRINSGQSTLVTGSPRSGKTSVLEYLMAPEKQTELYDNDADKLIFSYWDACDCKHNFNLNQFWARVLKPLEEYINAQAPNSAIANCYQVCKENGFDSYQLEKLIAEIKKINKRLVLIIDEFDSLLNPSFALYSPEFFGGLRTLSSRGKGAFVLVVTANISRSRFREETQQFQSEKGSPYLNFMEAVYLGKLSDSDINELLHRGKTFLKKKDNLFIKQIAGAHPYLLQVAASTLWQICENSQKTSFIKKLFFDRYQPNKIQELFYGKVRGILDDIWKSWDEQMQEAFIAITSTQTEDIKEVFEKRNLDVEALFNQIPDFKDELKELERYGFTQEDNKINGGWQILPNVFLLFIPDKLKPKKPFAIWLKELIKPSKERVIWGLAGGILTSILNYWDKIFSKLLEIWEFVQDWLPELSGFTGWW